MRKFICFGLSLIILLGGIAWSIGLHISTRDERAAKQAYNDSLERTTGTITKRSPQSNRKRTYDYTYTVDGEKFNGQVTLQVKIGRRIQHQNIHHVGDSVTVWYEPADPSVSMLGKPDASSSTWLPAFLGFLLSFTVFTSTLKWAIIKD